MRKIYSILVALLLMPALAFAAGNQAISIERGTYKNSAGESNENLVYVDYTALGWEQDATPASGANFSVGIWFKTTGVLQSDINTAVLMRLGTQDHNNSNGAIQLMQRQNGALSVNLGGDNTGGNTNWDFDKDNNTGAQCGTAALNEWHHLLLSFNSANTTLTAYLDGEKTVEAVAPGVFGYKWKDGVFAFGGYLWSGNLDEIQMFNAALTDEEAAKAYKNAKAVSSLTALYTFDAVKEGTTAQFESSVGNANSASFENSVFNNWWAGGLVYRASHTEKAPTFVEGRVVSYEVSLTVPESVVGGTLEVTVNGEAKEAGTYTISSDDEVVVTATPAEGYTLVGVYAGEKAIQNGVAFNLDEDAEISATFSQDTYALNINNSCNIPYTLTNSAGEEVNLAAVAPGTVLRLTVNVPDTHIFQGIKFNMTDITTDKGYYEFVMPAGASEILIAAREKEHYTVTIEQPVGGTVTVTSNGAAINSGEFVLEGNSITLAATPASGYTLVSLLVNGQPVAENTYLPYADVTVSAEFEEGVDYCEPTPNSGHLYASSKTTRRTDRTVTSIVATAGENSVTISGNGTNAGRQVYADRTASVLTAQAGDEVTLAISGSGEWMHTHIFVDFDRNGFDMADKVFSHGSEGNYKVANTVRFTIPADVRSGKYRVRYKLDWDDQDPCIYGQSGNDNGEAVIDFMLEIPATLLDAPRTVSVSSVDETLGTAEITFPEGAGSEVSTDQKNVVLTATPAEGLSFMNWTKDGEVVSTENPYTYSGEEDAAFVANFGGLVNFTCGDGGSIALTADGEPVSNGTIVKAGAEMTLTITAPTGKMISLTINGENIDVEGNTYAFTLNSNVEGDVQFVDRILRYHQLVSGNGTVECWSSFDENDNDIPAGVKYNDNDIIQTLDANGEMTVLNFWFTPAEGSYLQSAIFTLGDDSHELTYNDGGLYSYIDPMSDELTNAGVRVWWTQEEIYEDVTMTVTFAEGDVQGLESIGIDAANGPVEYYNLQGVRVAAENLTSGFYVARQGEKAVKIFIKK